MTVGFSHACLGSVLGDAAEVFYSCSHNMRGLFWRGYGRELDDIIRRLSETVIIKIKL